MTLTRRTAAEAVGTALLLALVVGSGIMAERLAGGNAALALLANAVATGAGLVALIHTFGPVSGAHFNPVVTAIALAEQTITARAAALYLTAQVVGAICGVWLAHAMFDVPVLQLGAHARDGGAQALAEAVATFGLIGTILATQRHRPETTPFVVGLYITAAYWFTASTAFANPAVTIARSLTTSFAGIAPHSVPLFLAGQMVGAAAAFLFFRWLLLTEEIAR